MNILLLSPIRSGSSLLQRLITVYMNSNRQVFSKPVIDLHDLEEGIIKKYYSSKHNQHVLKNLCTFDDTQPLSEITELINSTAHDVIGRVTYHHINENRNDSQQDIQKFINFINDNFYIIECQRSSVFEFALSNGIKDCAPSGNVCSPEEKINLFTELYKTQITMPIDNFIKYLNRYKNYIKWTNENFNVSEVYVYERDMPEIDKFIHKIGCFSDLHLNSWNDMFDISWKDWNKCHRLHSDICAMPNLKQLDFKNDKQSTALTTTNIVKNLPATEQDFMIKNAIKYSKTKKIIENVINGNDLGIGVPIKLQTLVEKKMIIKNFNECAVVYNEWAIDNGFPVIKDNDEIINQAYNELKNWYTEVPNTLQLK